MARRRHKRHRRNPKGHARRRRRHLRRNPLRGQRRRRRRNPGATEAIYGLTGGPAGRSAAGGADASIFGRAKPARKKGKKLTKKQRASRRRRRALSTSLMKRSVRSRAAAKRAKPRSLRRAMYSTQARRYSTLRTVALRGGKVSKSPVAKAMHLKTNPGLAGLLPAAKVIVPQAVAGGVAMFGLAFAGKKLANMITHESAKVGGPPDAQGRGTEVQALVTRKAFLNADGTDKAIVKYVPALSTAVLTGVGFVIADKVAPKFKGAVAIGGILGAIVQAIVAKVTADAKPDSLLAKVQAALLGDYTTVGGLGARAYAEGGIFREVGAWDRTQRPRASADNQTEYATNGIGAWDRTQRPRNTGDNQSEWATNGLDDTTEFASGEGGILSGGMFRGPSTR